MVEGFDKEIDFLLRQTAQGETVSAGKIPDSTFQFPDSNHLDPDEISAFAENALPEKVRQSYITHLADCGRCRKDLAGLIALNGEAESENISAEQSLVTEIIAPKIPWYRKLFAVPGLAYAMGALILVFAGVGVFTVLQNNSRNSEVSQTYEKQIGGGKGMSSDGDAATQEVYSNRMSSNSAAMSNMSAANTMANASNFALSAAPTASNSNATAMRSETNSSLRDRKDTDSLSEPMKPVGTPPAVGAMPPPPPPKASDSELDDNDRSKESSPVLSQNQAEQNQSGQNQSGQNQTQITPDTKNAPRAPVTVLREQKQEDKSDAARLAAKKKSAETTSVGGKTFNRGNNVWTDAAYRGQATTNVTRGTKEYKKLDSGLRGIVENLGGTVVVVWKEKAYRIQ